MTIFLNRRKPNNPTTLGPFLRCIEAITLRSAGTKKATPSKRAKRLGICLGVANGLHYLHALAQPKVIHRDNNLEPKIVDFGLALLFPGETSHIMTLHIAGTK
jgi:serine/threonine protein kinase